MRRTIAILASTAVLCGSALAVPSASFASAQSETHKYDTVMTQTLPVPSGGAIVGKMTLSMSKDGIINGWYTPADAGPPVEVTGGASGDSLWLDIGSMGTFRVYGALKNDGTIAGTATQYPRLGSNSNYIGEPPAFSFVAKPAS